MLGQSVEPRGMVGPVWQISVHVLPTGLRPYMVQKDATLLFSIGFDAELLGPPRVLHLGYPAAESSACAMCRIGSRAGSFRLG
jgi:hypothetical protein